MARMGHSQRGGRHAPLLRQGGASRARSVTELRCEGADRGPYFFVVTGRAARDSRGGRKRDRVTGELLWISALPETGGVDRKTEHSWRHRLPGQGPN